MLKLIEDAQAVASMLADYLVREKTRLDKENPLFKDLSREAESLVRAVTTIVNQTAFSAKRQRSKREAVKKQASATRYPRRRQPRGR
jgi:hypothetical protein